MKHDAPNTDARTITVELTTDELDDLEWALSMARQNMNKRSRETDVRRNPQRRASVNDARNAFSDLKDAVAEAKMELAAAELVAEMEAMEGEN